MQAAQSCPGLCGGPALVLSSTYLSALAVALVAALKCGNAAHTRRGSEPSRTIAAAAPPASLRKRRRGDAVSWIIPYSLSADESGYCTHGTPAIRRVHRFSRKGRVLHSDA